MGAKINIGFVKSEITTLKGNFDCLIDFLNISGMKIKSVKYATDENGLNWIESSNPTKAVTKELVYQLEKMFYWEFNVAKFPYANSLIDVLLKIHIYKDNFYSFMIEIEEATIINCYEIKELEFVEAAIFNIMEIFLLKLTIDYAFSSQEAEVEFSPQEFKNLTKPYYSLEAKYENEDLVISKARWYINGVTEREN
ncbi:Imm64 family immunity protein [Lysinibacillus sp. NPDC097195]|uniref:Imm64 family immunity protein n=1 Tax=Lysinibacillus sp. NPDC097195 TaxID=3364141 RepID=UPI00380AEF60